MSAALKGSAPSPNAAALENMTRVSFARPLEGVFPIDAALVQRGMPTYSTRREGFAAVVASWVACIAGERLHDFKIPSLFELSVDPRDGALTRGQGGLAYTPHAWSQLISLFKANKSPIADGLASVDRWHSPLTRHFGFEDVKRASRRDRSTKGEAVLRTFQTTVDGRAYRALRAVVSGIHGLTDTDDSTVIKVLGELEETPVEGRVSRGWDKTYGSFVLDSGDADVRLGFGFTNSETGCGSYGFNGNILIKALDAEISMPEGQRFEHMITIASAANATRRRHTLPRFDTRSGRALSDAQRTAIARDRISEDVGKALNGARVLAQRWGIARANVLPAAVQLASLSGSNDNACGVLLDVLSEAGCSDVCEALGVARVDGKIVYGGLRELAKVIADDSRLRSLPHGSAAHMAAALALLAVSRVRTWEETRMLQTLSGRFVMEGWKR